jgi:pimeloyl-ACP methyl ester carboxylesterase
MVWISLSSLAMRDTSNPLAVERIATTSSAGRRVSALRWGKGEPEIVLLHGGAQNAHTWDAVARALARPLLCLDLPGHGHSAWRDDHDYRPQTMVGDVAEVICALAPRADLVGGMSLGGMTAIALAGARPDLVRRLAVIDVAPGSGRHRTGPLFTFVNGPAAFPSLEAMIDRAAIFVPTRQRESLERAVRHNATEQPDGTWRWRYDWVLSTKAGVDHIGDAMLEMWATLGPIDVPTLLVIGANSGAVSRDDIREWQRRQSHVDYTVVEGAGHAVQSDQPVTLARLLSDFLDAK